MIVKNESQHLERCLASAQPYVDEIVIVDTGSEDNTLEIAARYGATLDYFEWCDDFSAARNYSLSKVSGEWILHLDADEELVVEDVGFRQHLLARPQVLIYALPRIDLNVPQVDVAGGFHARLFRNLPGFQYQNRYHEQLQYTGDRPLVFDQLQGLKILHYGNSDEATVHRKALIRDIPILERIRQEDGLSFWLLDCLARNYLRTEQPNKAQECYVEALDRLLPHLLSGEKPLDFYWVATLMHYLAGQSLDQDDLETARLLCQRGLEWFPTHLPLTYFAGELLLHLGFPRGAIAYFQQCLSLAHANQFYSGEPFERSLLGIDPLCAIGCAYIDLQDWQSAIAAFEAALAIDPTCAIAQQNLDNIRPLIKSDQ